MRVVQLEDDIFIADGLLVPFLEPNKVLFCVFGSVSMIDQFVKQYGYAQYHFIEDYCGDLLFVSGLKQGLVPDYIVTTNVKSNNSNAICISKSISPSSIAEIINNRVGNTITMVEPVRPESMKPAEWLKYLSYDVVVSRLRTANMSLNSENERLRERVAYLEQLAKATKELYTTFQ